MKIINELFQVASEKGHAKKGSYELSIIQGDNVKLVRYGTLILSVEYKHDKPLIIKNSTSSSDSRAINSLISILKLKEYKNSLKSFKDWILENPSAFDIDNLTSKEYKENDFYIVEVERFSPMDKKVYNYKSYFKYNKENKSFQHVKSDNLIEIK